MVNHEDEMRLEDDWDSLKNDSFPELDWDSYFSAIEKKIQKHETKRKNIKFCVASVCMLLLIVLTSKVVYRNGQETIGNEMLIVSNTSKNIKAYRLVDGSQMWLSPGAYAKVPKHYNKERRDIYLFGRGEFKVFPDKAKSFIVYSSHLATQAIGTAFIVENKPQAKKETVFLKEGIVQVDVLGNSFTRILAVNDLLRYNRISRGVTITSKEVSKKTHSSFKDIVVRNKKDSGLDNQFLRVKPMWYSFDNASLVHLMTGLERIYHVHIKYERKEISDKYFIGKFSYADSVTHVLDVITSLNGLQYKKISENVYEIYK